MTPIILLGCGKRKTVLKVLLTRTKRECGKKDALNVAIQTQDVEGCELMRSGSGLKADDGALRSLRMRK